MFVPGGFHLVPSTLAGSMGAICFCQRMHPVPSSYVLVMYRNSLSSKTANRALLIRLSVLDHVCPGSTTL